MEQPTQFRSSFNGFNREDVVRYMEFISNKHSAQVAQLTNELEYLRGKQETMDTNRVADLEKQLSAVTAENDTLKHRIAVLEHSLQEATAALAQQGGAPQQAAPVTGDSELEAYRRAERVERTARERARQVGQQTAAALNTAAGKVEGSSDKIAAIAGQILEQLNLLQSAAEGSRQAFQDAAGIVEKLHTEIGAEE